MKLSERIKLIHKESGLSQRDFAATIGVTEGYVSKLLKGGLETISESLALLIECKYGYNSNWVMTGEGESKQLKKKNSFMRARTQNMIDQLGEKEIEAVMAFVNSMDDIKKVFAEIYKSNDEHSAAAAAVAENVDVYQVQYEVPLLGRVAGGMPILAIQEYGKKVQANIKCDCALELVGDSMEPDYVTGDTLLVHRQPELLNGELGIIMRMEGADIAEVTFKRFYQDEDRVILKPINKNHPEQILSKIDVIIYGKVVGKV